MTGQRAAEAAATTGPLEALPFIPFPECPELNYLQLLRTMYHLEHETIIVNDYGQTEAAHIPCLGQNHKHIHIILLYFKEIKTLTIPLLHSQGVNKLTLHFHLILGIS